MASSVDGVPGDLPALAYARELSAKASRAGFDWDDPRGTLDKVVEEVDEVRGAFDDPASLTGEVGDLLFAVVNLSRHRNVDPEAALRIASAKFRRRIQACEALAARAGHRHPHRRPGRPGGAVGGRQDRGATRIGVDRDEVCGGPTGLGRRNGRSLVGMCRNITELRGLQPPATAEEISAAARQYVRKVSGLSKVPAGVEDAFEEAVREVTATTTRLLHALPARRQPPPTVPPLRRPEVQARLEVARGGELRAPAP